MPIEYVVDSLDQVSEDVRGAYVEAEGKFNFDADKYAELKAAGLKKKNNELLGKLKQGETELAKFGKLKPLVDVLGEADETELEEFQTAWQKRHETKGKGKPGDDQQQQLELKERIHQREMKKLMDEIAQLKPSLESAQARLDAYELWTPLRDEFIKADGEPADWELVRLELQSQGRFGFDEDRKIVVLEDGQPSSVTPEKFFKQIYSEQRPKFYRATGAGGSGAHNNTNGSGRGVTITRDQAKDPNVYRAAKERAAKMNTELQIVG